MCGKGKKLTKIMLKASIYSIKSNSIQEEVSVTAYSQQWNKN